ncbi:MAG: hypothetical protein ACW963_09015, partial [Candidatus Sifarchaeia archaeon]
EENRKKAREIEKDRVESREKGERLSMNKVTPMFRTLESPSRLFYVVDCELQQLQRLISDFGNVHKIKIIPVETGE